MREAQKHVSALECTRTESKSKRALLHTMAVYDPQQLTVAGCANGGLCLRVVDAEFQASRWILEGLEQLLAWGSM